VRSLFDELLLCLIEFVAGDEWMSNPAWKKTAERMLTAEVKKAYVDSKPAATLQLDWVVRA